MKGSPSVRVWVVTDVIRKMQDRNDPFCYITSKKDQLVCSVTVSLSSRTSSSSRFLGSISLCSFLFLRSLTSNLQKEKHVNTQRRNQQKNNP